jgi:hypothetical protein
MGFVMDEVALGQVFSEYFGFPSIHTIPYQIPHPRRAEWTTIGIKKNHFRTFRNIEVAQFSIFVYNISPLKFPMYFISLSLFPLVPHFGA